MLRGVMVAAAMLAAVPAMAGEMSGDEAKRWVTGKLFSYNCFEGTRGAGRVFADGSVIGIPAPMAAAIASSTRCTSLAFAR